MEPTVSIIVPVYQAEKYLRRCVDSILGQEYPDFELILADDGSADHSGEICEEYAERDSRVRVFHKKNSGVSDTRNLGIEKARGEYLQFVDSDDWLTRDATKLMVRAAKEHRCDLVISDFYRVAGDFVSHKGDIEEDGVLSQEEFAACMMENPSDFYYGVLWNKLYRRDIVKKHGLRMNRDISWCEDFMFNLEYIRHAESFYALRTPVYYYVKNKGSLIYQNMGISKTVKMKLMMFEYYNNFYKHVLDEEDYEKNRLQVYRFLVDAAGDGFVLPTVLAGARKLGDERMSVIPEAVSEEGMIFEAYRRRKLFERYLEPAALKFDLTMAELYLLLYLKKPGRVISRKNLAELFHMSRGSLAISMQRLTAKKMISAEELPREKGEERRFRISLLPAAEAVLPDLETAGRDFEEICFSGFSGEEQELYERLNGRMRENIRRGLR